MSSSTINHDLTEHGAKEPTPPVGDSPGLNIEVATLYGLQALDVELGLEEGVVES